MQRAAINLREQYKTFSAHKALSLKIYIILMSYIFIIYISEYSFVGSERKLYE